MSIHHDIDEALARAAVDQRPATDEQRAVITQAGAELLELVLRELPALLDRAHEVWRLRGWVCQALGLPLDADDATITHDMAEVLEESRNLRIAYKVKDDLLIVADQTLEKVLKERDEALRESERLRTGRAIEGDYVSQDSLAAAGPARATAARPHQDHDVGGVFFARDLGGKP